MFLLRALVVEASPGMATNFCNYRSPKTTKPLWVGFPKRLKTWSRQVWRMPLCLLAEIIPAAAVNLLSACEVSVITVMAPPMGINMAPLRDRNYDASW